MRESLLYRACSNVTQLLIDKVPTWANGGGNGVSTEETTDALVLVLAWPGQLRQLAESLWKQAVHGQVDHFQVAGQDFLKLADDQIRVIEELQRVVVKREQEGAHIRRAAELKQALEALTQTRTEFEKNWPWINADVLAESRAEYARGEFQSVAEILDELQGSRPQ
jgi:hypothetical protein